jgi:Dolichyl-phosphate-mannose-protein mannosyltransferase
MAGLLRRAKERLTPANLAVLGLLSVFALLALASLPFLSLTTDEPIHYRYGTRILASDAGRFDDSVMPISALNAIPSWLGEHLPESRVARVLRHFQVARLPTLLAAVGLGWVVFAWSKRLYGTAGGLLSLCLYTFDPNLLAHSRLITQDLFLTASIVLFLYLTWRFLRRRTLGRAMAAAVALGVAQTAKYTGVALFPLLGLLVLVYDLPRLIPSIRRRRWGLLGRYLGKTLLLALLFLFVAAAVINLAFLREYTFRPLHEYEFRSDFFQAIQRGAGGMEWLRVPVPYPYVQGLDRVIDKERTGQGHGKIYLLGELRHPEGFPGYFLIAYALKTPIAMQVIFVLSLALLIRRWTWAGVLRKEQILLVPLLAFLVYFNFFYQAQLGLRFVLMTIPLLHILSGRLGQAAQGWSSLKRGLLGVGLASIALSTLSYYPDYLAYFNEIVWDRRTAYRYLADSNLDWGQSETFLRDYLAAHPEAIVDPTVLSAGEVIVRVNSLVGITEDPERYAHLREDCFPDATIGHAYLLYRLPCGSGDEVSP